MASLSESRIQGLTDLEQQLVEDLRKLPGFTERQERFDRECLALVQRAVEEAGLPAVVSPPLVPKELSEGKLGAVPRGVDLRARCWGCTTCVTDCVTCVFNAPSNQH